MEVKNLSIRFKDQQVLDQISLKIPQHKLTMVLGVNGAGKSSLVKALKNLIPFEGQIYIDHQNIQKLSLKQMARKVAYMSQKNHFAGPLTVLEYLEFARHPYANWFSIISRQDRKIIKRWVHHLDLAPLLAQDINQLSGGQRQRVLLAAALVQDTPYIILDEPNNNLDIKYKLELIKLLKQIPYKTIIFVTHDLNDALKYADQIVILHQKKVAFNGSPQTVTSELLAKVFDVKVKKTVEFSFFHK